MFSESNAVHVGNEDWRIHPRDQIGKQRGRSGVLSPNNQWTNVLPKAPNNTEILRRVHSIPKPALSIVESDETPPRGGEGQAGAAMTNLRESEVGR